MSVRFLLSMLIALAMTMAPQAMPNGEAAAAAPAHHGQMAEHCPDQPQPDQPDPEDKDCCVAGCMAAAALPTVALQSPVLGGSGERPPPDRFRRGYLGDIATPPPRLA